MNRVAFQTYGTKKLSLFQSVWKTTETSAVSTTEQANITGTGTNWALAGTNLVNGGYNHTTGSAAVLQFGLTPIQGQSYQMKYTVTGTGYVIINFGGVSSAQLFAGSNIIITMTPITAATLSITPLSTFVGNISLSIKQSSSATNQIQLPISIGSGKSIWVDWGDGQYSTMNNSNIVANRIHTYAASGEYPVRVFGDDFNFGFGNGGFNDRLKLKSISSWGKLKIGTNSFNSCSKVTMSGITDLPDLTGVTSFNQIFSGCSAITTVGRINEWNTSSVNNLLGMFSGCLLFNQCIGSWNVSNVTTFEGTFSSCREFNNGDNSVPLNNWTLNTTSSVSLNYPFIDCRKFNRYIGDWNTSKVNVMADMFQGATIFNNGFAPGVGTGNQLNWDTSSCTNMSRMFISAPAFNSNVSLFNVSKVTTFNEMFTYCTAFNNGFASGVANQLPWTINTTASVSMDYMFNSAPAFNSNLGTGTTPWDVSKVTTFQSMFQGASKFNNGNNTAPINNWSINTTATSVNMTSMFKDAFAFNREVSSWNVSKVTSFSNMFFMTYNSNNTFNNGDNNQQNLITGLYGLDGWNINTTSTSIDFSRMFYGAKFFNRPIGSWNMNKATNIGGMFEATFAFNQSLSNWERVDSTLANVTNMSAMFNSAIIFNQDISKWNVGKVTSFASMFGGAIAFTNGLNTNTNLVTGLSGINGWNINTTATSVSMANMFDSSTAFNRNIGSWNVSKVTSMASMFNAATAFNQPIGSWDVSKVTSMGSMFSMATAFNQPIGSWNVSSVTDMYNMFSNSAFNQSLSNWERVSSPDTSTLANVTTMERMFYNATAFNNGLAVGLPGTLTWNTIGVTTMSQMFSQATSFNCNVGGFNVSACSNFIFMFRSSNSFNNGNNASIGSWILKTTGFIPMDAMFQNAYPFNQPIGSWNVSRVTNMRLMFSNSAFNQNIGSWNVSNVTNFSGFMDTKTPANLSAANLDAIYNGWGSLPSVKPNTTSPLSTNISFGTAKYTSAGTPGKNILLAAPNNWIIQDGGI